MVRRALSSSGLLGTRHGAAGMRRAIKMMKGVEELPFDEESSIKALSLENKGDRARLCSVVLIARTRGNGQNHKHRRFS